MKPLLTFACLLCSVMAVAQNHNYDSVLRKMIEGNGLHLNNGTVVLTLAPPVNKVAPTERDANGRLLPGVHRLPQDGMPCVVPDTKDIAAIPNFYNGKVSVPYAGNTPHIPNPSIDKIKSFQYRIMPPANNK